MILSLVMFSCFAEAPASDQLAVLMKRVQMLQEQEEKLDHAEKAAAAKVAELAEQFRKKGKTVAQKKAAVEQISREIDALDKKGKTSQSDLAESNRSLAAAQEKLHQMQTELEQEIREHHEIGLRHETTKSEHITVQNAYAAHAKTIGSIHNAVTAPSTSVKLHRSSTPIRAPGLGHHRK